MTAVCDQCELGTYSYFNKCYSYCPDYYFANDEVRACVLPGGYPLNMTIEVDRYDALTFKVYFKLLLHPALLATTGATYVTLQFRTQTESSLLYSAYDIDQSNDRYYTTNNNMLTRRML